MHVSTHVRSNLGSTEEEPAASAGSEEMAISDALRVLAGIAKHTVQSSEEPTVGMLFEEPLESAKVARAYSMVQDGPAANKDDGKLAMRIIRDLLVLHICGGEASGPWDNKRLQAAMNSAFPTWVDEETMSQLVHSFKKIVEYGKDRAKFDFDMHAAKVYGEPLEANQADQIFAAYASIARESPQCSKATGKLRKRSGRQRSASPDRQRAASPEAAAGAAGGAAGGGPPGLEVPLAGPQFWRVILVPGIGHWPAEAMLAWTQLWQQMWVTGDLVI